MKTLFEKLLDVLIYIVIIIGMVISYYGQRQDTLTQQLISIETSDIVNTVQTQGVLTKEVYEDFLKRLNVTDMIYNIKLEHKRVAIEPEYRLKTAEEIINDQNGSYAGGNIYHYIPVSTEFPVVNDPNTGDLTMNTETNASILAGATNTPSLPGHTHTDACYDGHRHTAVYGSNSLVNEPVYFQYSNPSWFEIKTYCSRCKKPIYNIKYIYSSGITGSTILYGYDSKGVQSESVSTFNAPLNSAQYYAFTSYISNLRTYMEDNGANSSNNNTSRDVYWGFGNLPTWGSTGIRGAGIPFIGCTYEENHANLSACFPTGKMGKVIVNASSNYDGQGWGVNITVKSVDNNKELLSIGIRSHDNWLTSNFTAGISTHYADYDSNGVIYDHYYNSMVGQFDSNKIDTIAWNVKCEALREAMVAKVISLPRIASSTENGLYFNITTPAIDWPFSTFPVMYWAGDLSQAVWEPIRGDVYSAAYGSNYSCGLVGITAPNCDQKVVSINPTHPIQAVYVGEELITTVTATYQDGSTKVVIANSDFNTDTPLTNKIVTLSYTDTLGNTITCTINVTVILKTKTCENGHTYNLNNNGTDPGCPYCKLWLRSLEVVDPADGNITIYRGTTLQENGVLLMATYLDGRKELLDAGYVNNLDKNYIGSQTVTISYKGKYASLNVTVKRNIVQCPVCKRYYELFPDDTDPGCPYCASRVPVFTGNVLKYYAETFSNEILEEIYDEAGAYYFNTDDYFSISITNKVETTGTKVLKVFFRTAPKVTIHVEQGGKIRNKVADEGEK